MATAPGFPITYWGVTGTLSSPIRPAEVTDKLVRALHHLLEKGQLAGLRPGPDSLAEVRRCVEEQLPFPLRSTYGGNTTCVEVQTPDALLIFDCGSGLREFGRVLNQRWNAPDYSGQRVAHVLITHPHMDHTYAPPFVHPYFDPRNNFTLYGSSLVEKAMKAVLDPSSPLSTTYFPPTYDMLKAVRNFRTIEAGQTFTIGSTTITTYALNHPGGCVGFRLDNA